MMAMLKQNKNTNEHKKKENRSLKSRWKIIINTREILFRVEFLLNLSKLQQEFGYVQI